ncbi:MAG: prolyl oligopeptidase family serine peptidase [Deltaproteobacteria bacterium]|nr:prolyl oligopeptidase family serine peptidase [Deltaproteobacteria bacterium]
MRNILKVFFLARLWILFLCLLIGCAYPVTRTANPVSGTFRDDFNLRTGKHQRHFLLHSPQGYSASRAYPLVVVLHGAFSTAKEIAKWSEWSQLADREGLIVIYPEGIGILGFLQHWNAGHCCGKAAEEGWNDVAFIEAAINGTCRQYAVDKRRIYMMGFSNGGMMTYRFAVERSFLLAAAASVSGVINSRATQNQPERWIPTPERPVPFLVMHGDADKTIPYEGGKPLDRKSTREYQRVADAADFWIAANKATAGPIRKESFDGMVMETSYMDSSGGNEVRVCRIRGWGHEWPGGPITRALPGNNPLKDFDAAGIIWRFFQQYSRP